MWSDWLVVCDCSFSPSALWSPLSVPTFLLGFLLPWTWGLSSRLLQQSAAAAPYLWCGVAPFSHAPAPWQPLCLSMKVKEESEKVGLKLNIQKTKIMASSPITSWEIDGETVETVADFIFLGFKITADGDCSHEIKRLTPWKESYDQPRQHIKKHRHYLANKGLSSQSYVFFQ